MYHWITIVGGNMTVTTSQIRDLLNRPRGLNEGTISEYITIRTAEVNKKARKVSYVGGSVNNVPDDTVKESAIKFLVAVDCLKVVIDTIPSWTKDKDEMQISDRRFADQLNSMQKSANDALKLIEEKGGSAFAVKTTKSRVGGSTTGELSGSLHSMN